MYIKDLTQFTAGHPPSPYNFPIFLQKDDVWGQGILPDGLSLFAVGWLGDRIPSKGVTPSECISRLWYAYKPEQILSDGTAGFHNCELCHGDHEWYPDGKVGPVIRWGGQQLRLYGHGHLLLRFGQSVNVIPALILHYILDHGYKPPDVFIEAVCQGEFLGTNDLEWVEDETSQRE